MSQMIVQVILAGDFPIFRAGVKALMREPDVRIVAECETGSEVVAAVRELRADLVVLTLPLPDMAGDEVIRELMPQLSPPYVLVMTDAADDQIVLTSLRAGARSFLSQKADPREFLDAVRIAAVGGGVFSPVISVRLSQILRGVSNLGRPAFPTLTRRELEILELIGRGYDNKRISMRLVLADKTVRNHVSNVLTKLQVTNRMEALIKARNAGLCS